MQDLWSKYNAMDRRGELERSVERPGRPALQVWTNPGHLVGVAERRLRSDARRFPEPGWGRLEGSDGIIGQAGAR